MSTASKVTFGLTCVFSVVVIYGVYDYQNRERQALRLGPVRDAERIRKKHESQGIEEAPVLTPQQESRKAEYELQKKLQAQYQQVQTVDPVSAQYGPSTPTTPTNPTSSS
ncbi:uncharacterized protein SAPINGB_P004057 [Magnusiomyces paraingens]|uniref:Protein PET117, mitochondrial n=1 Tax=Magnusiomyces paraingens TaxID=2606893 RepID=A0A5E8BTJ3_9ASCO|nr:uncharacterized protein SAPINGB_P004057 [Saprochaete ingens]VVT54401.1 unnamed protein product [Saprochaete ingens]